MNKQKKAIRFNPLFLALPSGTLKNRLTSLWHLTSHTIGKWNFRGKFVIWLVYLIKLLWREYSAVPLHTPTTLAFIKNKTHWSLKSCFISIVCGFRCICNYASKISLISFQRKLKNWQISWSIQKHLIFPILSMISVNTNSYANKSYFILQMKPIFTYLRALFISKLVIGKLDLCWIRAFSWKICICEEFPDNWQILITCIHLSTQNCLK